MYANPMYDNISNGVNGYAGSICNLHVSSSSINGLETIDYKFIFERDNHISSENDPKRTRLNDTETKRARYIGPYFPPIDAFPKPTEQSANASRLVAQLMVRQQESMTFISFAVEIVETLYSSDAEALLGSGDE
ncbi:proline synthase co-transcribed bacterial-like protein [Gossypium australe]|uniref:Proline synthase co-transcribed bacterial-like protein n=1 Tax=Gossypium australe TaxID=47621 RepID=A0A5B6WA42_9ROSI|nr:proline synthase co-transcribed bacterial-like protein [Gossypium australe]